MIPKLTVLTQAEIAHLATYPEAIKAVETAFKLYARQEALMPAKVYLPLPKGNDFRAMPAYLRHPAACGVKWVNVHPNNPKHGLPTVMAVIVLNDPATGVPLAVMDGSLITKMRTAAAGAVAAKALANPKSSSAALIGCGGQADAQLLALACVAPLKQVNVWGYLPGEAKQFCRAMQRFVPRIVLQPSVSVREAVSNRDIVVTITPSRKPLVKKEWIAPGTHINAIGADGPGKQELEAALLRSSCVVVDDYPQAIHGGELNVPVSRKQYDPKRIHASLGEVLIGSKKGRPSARAVTIFDSTGLAIHDVALALQIYRKAAQKGIGHKAALMQ